MEEVRKIIHVDMDAFYASVEQRDNPELRGIPLAVGGVGGRGVVAAASYEARDFGVHSAMPAHQALRKCPMLHFVRPNFEKYKGVSNEIHEVFQRYTTIIEPLALDEAFLDVTYSKYEMQSATLIAQQIKNDIKNELGLIASAGVSYNKFLAKIASDQEKPDGLFVITPDEGPTFVENLAIEKFFGVGKVTAEKMRKNNIFKGADLLPFAEWELQQMFGKMGTFLFNIARGVDNREVKTERARKSVGVENTFSDDLSQAIEINEEFSAIFEDWWARYQRHGKRGKTVTLKVRDKDFDTITRSITESKYIEDKQEIRRRLDLLLKEVLVDGKSIRLLGVSITGLEVDEKEDASKQLTLW